MSDHPSDPSSGVVSRPPIPPRPRSRWSFGDAIGVATGWLVVSLVVLGLLFVERVGDPRPAVRVMWYVLLLVAVGRAVYRTWSTIRRARRRGEAC